MSQPSNEVVSTITAEEPPLRQSPEVVEIHPKKSPASLIRGISSMTAEEAVCIFRNPSPRERSLYVGMLSYSPSTIACLRAEFSKPSESVPGELRTRILQILADAEKHINWEAIRMIDG